MAQGCLVRVGTIPFARTGPWTGGAQVSQSPTTRCGPKSRNKAGGLDEGRVKRKIELISSDDRSDIETVVRSYES